MTTTLVVPDSRQLIRRGAHTLFEGKVMPLLLFVGFLRLAGPLGALLAALSWSLSATAFRVVTGRRVSALVLFSVIGLSARTLIALLSGSFVVYFLQPMVTTVLVGTAFVVSVTVGKPLAQRLAEDFCPIDPHTLNHPHAQRFFVRLSLLWSLASMLNAAVTFWLLFTQPITTFVVVKSILGPVFTAIAVTIAVFGLRRDGVRLASTRRAPTA